MRRSRAGAAGERGMVTSEYVCGTVCTAGVGCALLAAVDTGWFQQLLEGIFHSAYVPVLPQLFGSWWP